MILVLFFDKSHISKKTSVVTKIGSCPKFVKRGRAVYLPSSFVFQHRLSPMKEGLCVVVERPCCSPPAVASPGGDPHARGPWPDPGREGHHPDRSLSHLGAVRHPYA